MKAVFKPGEISRFFDSFTLPFDGEVSDHTMRRVMRVARAAKDESTKLRITVATAEDRHHKIYESMDMQIKELAWLLRQIMTARTSAKKRSLRKVVKKTLLAYPNGED